MWATVVAELKEAELNVRANRLFERLPAAAAFPQPLTLRCTCARRRINGQFSACVVNNFSTTADESWLDSAGFNKRRPSSPCFPASQGRVENDGRTFGASRSESSDVAEAILHT